MLVPNDTNEINDVFVHTVSSGATVRVSVSSSGAQSTDPSSNGAFDARLGSINPSISASGRYVAFASLANNLTAGDSIGIYSSSDANNALDVFVVDRDIDEDGNFDEAGAIRTEMVSKSRFGLQTYNILGQQTTPASDIFPAISANGRMVAFPSDAEGRAGLVHNATNQTSPDANAFRDVFVFDRRTNALPNPGNVPVVSISSPGEGTTVGLNNVVAVSADASAPVGRVVSVEFFLGSVSLGTATTSPFSADWTPTEPGVYKLSALAVDSFGNQSVSDVVTVAVGEPMVATPADFQTGIYIDGIETGSVTLVSDGSELTFVATREDGSNSATYRDVPIAADGTFSLQRDGQTVLSGQIFENAAAIGQFGEARFSSSQVPASPNYTGTTEYIYGSITGSGSSETVFVPAPDGSLLILLAEDNSEEIATGTITSQGEISATTPSGGVITGTLDYDTGFLNGRITGGMIGGTITAAFSADTPPSNGVMFNLSTRGNIGSGDNVMVAGFVVSGDESKELLVRVLGPTIAQEPFNVPGTIPNPELKIFDSSNNEIAANDNWGTDSNVPDASALAGAFPLPNGSLDAATVVTLNPGVYTASASGIGGATGVGIVEIYDVVTPSAFSANKLINVSTRGEVGSGDNALIAGFIVNGTTSKRVLIRAVGPTLSTLGVNGSLADPTLRLIRQDTGATVRENDDWGLGNDATLVTDVAAQVGAFAFPSGSKDAALLITLPPGVYTAIVGTATGASGIALVEVYEVP